MQRIENWVALTATQRPFFWIIISLLVSAACITGLKNFAFDADPGIYFSDHHEHFRAFKKLEDVYGKADSVAILIKAKPGTSLYTPENLAVIEEATRQSWTLPYAQRVDSIANYNFTYSSDDEMYVEPLIEDALNMTPEQIARVEKVAKSDPDIKDRLASSRAELAIIRIIANLPKIDRQAEEMEMRAKTREMAAAIHVEGSTTEFMFSGNVFSNSAVTDTAANDVITVIPLMYAVIFVMLGVLLRSLIAVLSIWVITMLSCVAALGLASWIGIVINMMSITCINIIITVSIAHCVHILVYFFQQYHHGESKQEAIRESLRINLIPITLTSLTTALGFLSMNLSNMPPAHDLGNITAMGVVVAFLLSLFLLPPLLMLLPVRRRKIQGTGRLDNMMAKLAEFVILRRKILAITTVGVSLSLVALAPMNEMNDKFTENIKMPSEFRTHNQYIDEYFGGLYTIDYDFRSKEGKTISDPEYLHAMEKFANWMRQQEGVKSVQSYTDLIKRLNMNMHNDDPAYYKIPETQEEAAQYQLLYEMSLPFGTDMTNTIRLDKTGTRMIVSLPSTDTMDLILLQQKAQEYLKQELPDYMFYTGEGLAVMWAYLGQEGLIDGLKGALLALFLISLILMFVFKSLKYGIISLIPNLLPAGVGYGLWALIDGELSMGQMMVLSITIGIVVDDTVHFLSKYLRARRIHRSNAVDSVRYAFRQVGPALWITTAVLVLGFGMLLNSGFLPNVALGQLTMSILVAALILDFFLLPPLLIMLDHARGKTGEDPV